ncbi:agmatinase [Paraburkholderia sp. J63]|uniref:agmatinase n=1 Tax=Paraburkholderia sp. J63 TaxID=2805434 RepID=UPI002ABD57D7|nr:agmatinase [Paraburkholderia sp. J63]
MLCDSPKVPFLAFPVEADLSQVSATFAVIGAPYGVPYGPALLHCDSSNAPDKVRERSFRYGRQAGHYDFDLQGTLFGDTAASGVDCGNVPGTLDVARNAAAVTSAIAALLERGAIPIVLGGDDSIPPLCVRAFESLGPLNVLQFDAHLDFRDEVNGERHGYSSPIRRIREMPFVKRIVQVGLRGSGSARASDVDDALRSGNVIVPAETVLDEGIEAVTRHLVDDAPWFVTFDVDGLDPGVAPGVIAPLPGGLTFHQARGILKHLCTTTQLAGIDFVEYHPALDVREMTALTITRLLTNVLGFSARRLAA